MNHRLFYEWVFDGIAVTSGIAMAGGIAIGNMMIFGSGLFTILVAIPLYLTYRKEGEF